MSFQQVEEILDQDRPEPLLARHAPDHLADIGSRGRVVVGISVAFGTQIGCAIALAQEAKQMNPEALVVIGGGVVRRFTHNLFRIPRIFDVVDGFVETIGEPVLSRLTACLDANVEWRDTPGLIVCDDNGQVIFNPPEPFSIEENHLPAYDLLSTKHYQYPHSLCLRTSIGCYWNRCCFCTQALSVYQERSVEAVVRDMCELEKNCRAKYVRFTDEAVPMKRLSAIATGMIAGGASITWASDTRFDTELSDDQCRHLRESGCVALSFGLESAVQRVNDLMNKGVDVAQAMRSTEVCLRHGIACHVNAIIAFPGETEAEMWSTVQALREMRARGISVSLSIFTLNFGSHIFCHPEEYGISSIEDGKDFLFKDCFDYECIGQVSYEKALAAFTSFELGATPSPLDAGE
ncbi:MAG: radical SAM protein [Candidatus Electrothrix sp.]